MFLIMFNTGQALPLRKRRTWCPRKSRAGHAKYPRNIRHLWTWHRPVHGLDSAGNWTRTGTFRLRELSVSAFNPRQQSGQQTIHVYAQSAASIICEQATAADVDRPQTICNCDQSPPANWSHTRFVRDPGPPKNDTRRSITVSILPPIHFSIRVQIIPANDVI